MPISPILIYYFITLNVSDEKHHGDFLNNNNKHKYTPALVLRPFVLRLFALTRPCQFTPFHNVRPFIFVLTPFGWFLYIYLSIL
jgi:hypothetical protein